MSYLCFPFSLRTNFRQTWIPRLLAVAGERRKKGSITFRVGSQIGHHFSLEVTTKGHKGARSHASEALPRSGTKVHEGLADGGWFFCEGPLRAAKPCGRVFTTKGHEDARSHAASCDCNDYQCIALGESLVTHTIRYRPQESR